MRRLRLDRGLTLEAVAYKGDMDIATVSRVERRLVEPRRDTVIGLARALGVSVKHLLRLLEDPVDATATQSDLPERS